MQLVHFHAFAVSASNWGEAPNIQGGRIQVDAQIEELVSKNVQKAKFDTCLESVFETDDNRHNDMRELVRRHAFGDENGADEAAKEISERLSVAMDNRSHPALLLIASQKDGSISQASLWTFPRDEALRLINQRTASLQVLTDIFSQTSRLRKAAFFQGGQATTEFLGGKILDLQSGGGPRAVADFWLSDFLLSTPAIRPKAGTQMIAKSLIQCAKETADLTEQQQLQSAAMSIRSGPKQKWSPKEVADNFFGVDLAARFQSKFPNAATYNTSIEIDQNTYADSLNFAVYKLDSGVIVSSPFSEIGESVRITETAKEGSRLSLEGRVVSQKVRSPNGVR
ncbi:hypothetical protein NKI79_32070 [Mesorhizobium sp. M0340]|uniref:hypothetical protein n=1 Tax=Mesorhizobium sp. M0340 TaxID=2956939 RepID=UPI003335EE39